MQQIIATIAYIVSDYDEAIQFFVETLGFDLVEDTSREQEQPGKRWVVVRPKGSVGRDYNAMKVKGIVFTAPPREEAYGIVAVFLDLYGNKWDLIQPLKD